MSRHGILSMREVFRLLQRDGWTITPTRGLHYLCKAPDGVGLVVASGRFDDRGDPRAFRNFLRDLKRAGWEPKS